MPSTSPAQARLMAAVAHNKGFAKKVGIPQNVGKEFNRADAGTGILKRDDGGRTDPIAGLLGRLSKQQALDDLIDRPEETSEMSGYRPSFRGTASSLINPVMKNEPPPFRLPLLRPWQNYPESVRRRTDRNSEGKTFAEGGMPTAPWYERGAMYRLNRASQGFLKSSIPGRTDKLNLHVAPGSYVIPADTVSHLGQNNSLAGAKVLDRLFNRGPRGANLALRGRPRMGRMFMAEGGAAEGQENVPIIAAGSEYILTPEQVAEIGNGDVKVGHQILDDFVMSVRQAHIKQLKALPRPKK